MRRYDGLAHRSLLSEAGFKPLQAANIKSVRGERILGIPTIQDRFAQVVARLSFEPLVEPEFLNDSYGDRPKKSAIDAVRVTRKTLLVSRLGSGI